MLERLTMRSSDTSHENGVCCTHFNGPECAERAGHCTDNCPWEEAAWSRLADYEDTGLTPEEVAELRKQNNLLAQYGAAKFSESMKDFREINGLKVKTQSLEMSLRVACDALEKFTKAEREGRLVVLPCGDDVELVRDGETYKANHWNHTLTAFRDDPTTRSGKRVALFSIEEAGRALVTDTNVGRTIPVNDLYDEDGGDVLKGGGGHG